MLIVERGSEIGSTKMWTKYFMNKKEVETTIYKDTNATLDGNSSKQHQLKQGQRVIFYPKQSYEDEKNSGSLISLVGANGKPEKERYVVKFNVIAKPITKASTKEKAEVKSTQILKQLQDQTSEQILEQIKEKFKDNPANVLIKMTQDTIKNGYPNGTYDLSGLPVEAVTDYFCEILHPISLLKGKGYTGNADEAFKAMGITKNDSAAISYNIKTTTGLKDSEIKNNEKQLYLSSKGGRDGKGAAAAASNLYNLYIESNGDDIRNTYNQFSLEEKKKFVAGGEYAEAISILEKIQNSSSSRRENGRPSWLPEVDSRLSAEDQFEKDFQDTARIIAERDRSSQIARLSHSNRSKSGHEAFLERRDNPLHDAWGTAFAQGASWLAKKSQELGLNYTEKEFWDEFHQEIQNKHAEIDDSIGTIKLPQIPLESLEHHISKINDPSVQDQIKSDIQSGNYEISMDPNAGPAISSDQDPRNMGPTIEIGRAHV